MRLAILLLALSFVAADWPQFLGPNRDSSTKEVIAPWQDAPKQLWKQPVGAAHSSPVLAGGKVYAFYQDAPKSKENDLQTLAAFDAASGEKLWEQSYERPAFAPPFGKGPRSTPCVADNVVVTIDGTGLIYARDSSTGKEIWAHNPLRSYEAKNLFFGTSTSPIVVDDKVVMMAGGAKVGIASWFLKKGNFAWGATSDPASYSSPILDNGNLVFLTGSHLRAITPAGKSVWEYPFKDRLNESSTMPVKVGSMILGSSVTAGSVLLKIVDGKPEKVWANEKLTCYFSTPVVIGKHIYMINGAATLTNPAVTLRCVELDTGKVLWEKEKVGRYHAALVRTGDDKLLMLDDNGYLSLFADSAVKYDELARSKICGVTWAHPAIVDGKLYIRDEKHLYCFKLN